VAPVVSILKLEVTSGINLNCKTDLEILCSFSEYSSLVKYKGKFSSFENCTIKLFVVEVFHLTALHSLT